MNQNTAILCVIGAPLRWLGRVVYISGIICIGLNAIRSWRIYEDSAGIVIAAHVIALFSILSAFIRSERQYDEKNDF